MSIVLTPTEEHYLKRELLKFQLNHEFAALNDQYALRQFGFPFSSDDPTKDGSSTKRRLLRHMIPLGESSNDREEEEDEAVDNYMHSDTEFPMLSYVLEEIIMPFPLLSRDLAMDEEFWQKKVQVFYEHFESLGFSESYDREESTKRKRISKKLNKAILLLFNSGIGASQEREYYEHDKFKLQEKKATKAGEISMPTRDNLRNYVTSEPVFIHGWDVNVVAVASEAVVLNKPEAPKKAPRVGPPSPMKDKGSSYSKWMKPKFSSMQPSLLFSKLSLTDNTPKPAKFDACFLLRVKQESEPDDTIYVAKTYEDFKNLSRQLKSDFPGKNLAHLPHKTKKSISVVTSLDSQSSATGRQPPGTPKEKIVASMSLDSPQTASASVFSNSESDASSVADETSTEEWDTDEFQDATDVKSNHLIGERMRTSLRQYLRSLCGDEEVSLSSNLSQFLVSSPLPKESFSKDLLQDIKHRQLVDISNLETQVRFQKLALKRSIDLQDAMKELKTSLLKDENYLLGLIGELKVKTKVSDLSPLLRSFVEWCKVYLSSTIYQVFLGNDSGYEFYTQIKRLHKLVPYTVMAQIMRFTNPMGMMKAMMDLFMAQPFGGQSLLQAMFSTILSDDLKGQEKVTHELEQKILHDASGSLEIIECLKKTVFKNENGEIMDMGRVHEESDSMDMPACLVILLKNAENGAIAGTAVDGVIESYTAWKALKRTAAEKILPEQEASAAYFSHVKELFQLYVRERDKILMRKLWQDPELSQLLRSIVTLIYEPMVRIFKVARVDIALKNFEKFMDDLIRLTDDILNGRQGISSQFNVVDSINNLFTKHQDACLSFIHEVYIHDTEGIFEGFITWIVRIVRILQKSAFGGPEERIDFSQMLQKSKVDVILLRQQLDNVIKKKHEARATYSKLLEVKTRKEEQSLTQNTGKALETKWKQMNALVMPTNGETLGLGDGDLVDLDLDALDYENLKHEDDVELERKYKKILERKVDVHEIEKFGNEVFESKLKTLLFQNSL